MNIVVSSAGSMPGSAMTPTRWARLSRTPLSPAGSRNQMAADATTARPAMARNVPRQPAKPAISAPSGAPNATASVVPPTITAARG